LSTRIQIRYRILNIQIQIRTDLNYSKRIRSRIRLENIYTFFTIKKKKTGPRCGLLLSVGPLLPPLGLYRLAGRSPPVVINLPFPSSSISFNFPRPRRSPFTSPASFLAAMTRRPPPPSSSSPFAVDVQPQGAPFPSLPFPLRKTEPSKP